MPITNQDFWEAKTTEELEEIVRKDDDFYAAQQSAHNLRLQDIQNPPSKFEKESMDEALRMIGVHNMQLNALLAKRYAEESGKES